MLWVNLNLIVKSRGLRLKNQHYILEKIYIFLDKYILDKLDKFLDKFWINNLDKIFLDKYILEKKYIYIHIFKYIYFILEEIYGFIFKKLGTYILIGYNYFFQKVIVPWLKFKIIVKMSI